MIEYICKIGDGILPIQELIRCKDCKYWSANTQFCAMFSGLCTAHRMPPNGYCSEAERKEE